MKSIDKKSKQYKQLKHISDATLLEEASHLKLIFKGIIVVLVLIVAFFVWAAFVKINETTTTYGQLVPEGEVQVVQHLEGGIVQKVFVNDGDIVKAGQLLVHIASTAQEAELDQLRSREVTLILDLARINAFLHNKPPDIEAWGKEVIQSKYNPIKYKSQIDKLLQVQKRLLESEYAKLKEQTAALNNTVAQRQEKLKELTEQQVIWKKHMDLLTQEFDMYAKLKKNNYVSHKDYLTILRAVNKAKGDGARITSEIQQTQESIQEAQHKLKQATSVEYEEALEEVSKYNAELLEVRHKVQKLDDRISRTQVKAPIAGVVKGVSVFAGNVVKPGAILLEVVPQGTQLVGESKIMPQEIGYVKAGDTVNVKVLTYDYARYGSISGKLKTISASTFTDTENKPYYKAKISLEKQYIGAKEAHKPLRSGMTIQADIVTGEKTLLQYLLKPIHRSVSESFSER